MSNPYQRQAESAFRLIGAKGQAMTLVRLSLEGYDPVAPRDTNVTVAMECSAKGVVLPASNGTIEAFDDRILNDPAQRRSFRFVILAGLGLTFRPRAEDILITEEGAYRLLGATPLDPSGKGVIIYNVGCTLDTQIDLDSDTVRRTTTGGGLRTTTQNEDLTVTTL